MKIEFYLKVNEENIERLITTGFLEKDIDRIDIGDYKINLSDLCDLIINLAKNKNKLKIKNVEEELNAELSQDCKDIKIGKYKISSNEFFEFVKLIFGRPLLKYPPGEDSKRAAFAVYAIASSNNPFFDIAKTPDKNGKTINDYIQMMDIEGIFTSNLINEINLTNGEYH